LAGGYQVAVDGQSPLGQHGPWARAVLTLGAFELAAHAETSLGAAVELERTRIETMRRTLLGQLGIEVLDAGGLRLVAALAAGISTFSRETVELAEGLAPTRQDADFAALAIGAELHAVAPLLTGSVAELGIALDLGALALPAAPKFRVDTPDGRREQALWAVAPQLRVGAYLHFGP
jgi:hypothetical protein